MKRVIFAALTLSGFIFAQNNDSQVYYFNSTTTTTPRANNSDTASAQQTPPAQQNTQNVQVAAVVNTPAQPSAANPAENEGKNLFKKKCMGCHGDEGGINAFGISRKLAQMSSAEITERLKSFTDKKQTHNGASAVMSRQASTLSKAESEAIIKYISTLSQKDAAAQAK